ncbi:hypothetical protein [Amycolatopsis echigonensis]|uniref:Uncharacterized protein n=1 Tax=Amycolatopsis echigonensis TaxID=2576905 RepID=A0A8E1W7S9_9PSEU|nr:hypothetical protein [Amycolatopsis echigonensis]MBB2506004.1 hypothetical protein [Amycolatopsis echigonensis]
MSDPNTLEELASELAQLKAFKDRVDGRYHALRRRISQKLTPGSRLRVDSAAGWKLGTVLREDVKLSARIADKAAFAAWAAKAYPEETQPAFEITGSEKEVAEALYLAGATHLVKSVTVVADELRRKILDLSTANGAPMAPDGEADIPGVVIDRTGGTVKCQTAPDGGAAALEMLADGELLLDLLTAPDEDQAAGRSA